MADVHANSVPVEISKKRQRDIELGLTRLTRTEIEDGWHMCPDMDYMLLHPSWPEHAECKCLLRTQH
jgi:hypothetical protein